MLGNLEKAINDLEAVLKIHPTESEAVNELSSLKFINQSFQKAKESMKNQDYEDGHKQLQQIMIKCKEVYAIKMAFIEC